MTNKSKFKKFGRFAILASILLFIMILFSQTVGLFRTGFDSEDVLTQFFFYSAPGIAFLVGLMIIFILELIIEEGDSQYGDGVGFVSSGDKPFLSVFKNTSLLQIFILSVLFFGVVGLFGFITKQNTFTGIATLEQQFTPIDNIVFSTALVAASENLGAAFLIAFLLMGLRFVSRKFKLGEANFKIISITLIPLLVGLYGLANHNLRYQGSDIALLTVFIFWATLGLITMLSGSFIPGWVMHMANNLFFDLQRYFSRDTVLITVAISLVLIAIVYFSVYGFKFGRRKDVKS